MLRILQRAARRTRCPQQYRRQSTKNTEDVAALLKAENFGPVVLSSGPADKDPHTYPRPYSALPKDFTERDYAGTLVHGRSIYPPFFHPRTHDIPVASIQFRSYHPRLLDLMTHVATHAASALGIPTSRVIPLPTKRTLWTVPRSPFAHKKSQENFERRVHKRLIKAWDADPDVVERWTQYLYRHGVAGVGMRVVRWERLPLGFGASLLSGNKSQLRRTPVSEKIMLLGQQIIQEEMHALDPNEAPAENTEIPMMRASDIEDGGETEIVQVETTELTGEQSQTLNTGRLESEVEPASFPVEAPHHPMPVASQTLETELLQPGTVGLTGEQNHTQTHDHLEVEAFQPESSSLSDTSQPESSKLEAPQTPMDGKTQQIESSVSQAAEASLAHSAMEENLPPKP